VSFNVGISFSKLFAVSTFEIFPFH